MKYCIFILFISLLSCQENNPVAPIVTDQFAGNWLVIEETDKSNNIKQHSASGVITTWNGLSYIGAIKIKEDGSVKLNSFDGSYSTDTPDGTWTMNQRTEIITFNIGTFTKDFNVWKKDGFLYLESSTHLLKHEAIE